MKPTKIFSFISFISLCLILVFWVVYPTAVLMHQIAYGLAGLSLIAALVCGRESIVAFMKRKSSRYGANLALVVFLVFGILAFANLLSKNHHLRWDLTKSKINSLSPQTVKVLEGLEQKVHVQYFDRMGDSWETAKQLLVQYRYHSKHFSFELVDPKNAPLLTKNLSVAKYQTAVFSFPESANKKMVRVENAFKEEKLTNGLVKILKDKSQVVYFVSGHGEKTLQKLGTAGLDILKNEIENEVYTVKTLNLPQAQSIPKDATALILIRPSTAFFAREIKMLKDWLVAGGRLILSLDIDVEREGMPLGAKQIAKLLSEFGLEYGNRYLIDPSSQQVGEQPTLILGSASAPKHAITENFEVAKSVGFLPSFYFPLSTFIKPSKNPNKNFKITRLANTTPNAWAESNWSSLKKGQVRLDRESDTAGEMGLAYALESLDSKMRIVAFASSNFIVDGLIHHKFNKDLFLNSLAWLANQGSVISIRERKQEDSQINLNGNILNLIFLFIVILVPVLIFGSGIWVWYGRKSR